MKRAVILHGTDGNPEENWFPWLKARFEGEGYQVWVPELPENHTPNRELWDDRILGSRDMSDTIIVGHSSGAVEVLNLLMNPRCPQIRLGVMVSAWPSGEPVAANGVIWDPGQFDNLFPPDGFDPLIIGAKADKLAFLHGVNDPYCPLEATQKLADELGAHLTAIPDGGHLSVRELPELWQIIEPSL
jgi:predicted alpha/beta hydrolase family esterase